MGKVDCIVEMRQEEFDSGFDDGSFKMALKTAKKLLLDGFSESSVSYFTDLPMDEVKNLKESIID